MAKFISEHLCSHGHFVTCVMSVKLSGSHSRILNGFAAGILAVQTDRTSPLLILMRLAPPHFTQHVHFTDKKTIVTFHKKINIKFVKLLLI
jgi:hypothetical protein